MSDRLDICFMPAVELASRIRTGELASRDVMAAFLEQIRRVNPVVNAMVAKLDDDRCMALAEAADETQARGEPIGPLHGLPVAIKDLEEAAGFPLTWGSPIYKDNVARRDSIMVERMRRAGMIVIGKTNVPEFGMGSQTYNRVYGATRNPWDPTKTAGGSSGGAGAALAAGMLPLADGGDLGGSLRNPANFNNIVALRPSVGIVPATYPTAPFQGYGVTGPMARNILDLGLFLSVIAGPDPRDPGSLPIDPRTFRDVRRQASFEPLKGARVAWSPDLGGLPLDPRVRQVLESQRSTLETLGCIVEEACPDLSGADDVFLTFRRWRSWNRFRLLSAEQRRLLKPEAIHEMELGAKITADDLVRAEAAQVALLERMRQFEEKYDLLLCAVNQTPPFDVNEPWPKEIDGTKMEHYVQWMQSAYWITVTLRPSVSVPAGFTPEGLPVGLQMVGRYRQDLKLLQAAYAFEQATGFGKRRPALAAGP